MKDDYSFIAPFYNQLVRLVFGNQLTEAKTCFSSSLEGKKILIIGGGVGLDYSSFQSQLRGEYWELSRSMLSKAKDNLKNSQLEFHLGYYEFQVGDQFDEVWLHFVLDTMTDGELDIFLDEIKKSITPAGQLYLADFFEPQTKFQQVLHKTMIQFFRWVTSHRRKNIPDYEKIFIEKGWKKSSEKDFLKGWVKAQIWAKKD
jgi:SAM-dependent methyltransferase